MTRSGVPLAREREPRVAILRDLHRVPLELEVETQTLREIVRILDHEYARHEAGATTPRRGVPRRRRNHDTGELELERGARWENDRDAATHLSHEVLHDRETDAAPTGALRTRRPAAEERRPDRLVLLRGNTWPFVDRP